MVNKYSINVAWSDEDECFVATIPEFPNLSAFGISQEEAIADANIVIEMALESLKEDGISPPRVQKSLHHDFSGQVRLRMAKSLHRDLAESAKEEGVSLNTIMVTMLVKHNTMRLVNREVESKINRLFESQNQHFATIHRKLRQREQTIPESSSSFFVYDIHSEPRQIYND